MPHWRMLTSGWDLVQVGFSQCLFASLQHESYFWLLLYSQGPQQVAPHVWFGRDLCQIPFLTQPQKDLCLLLR